MAHIIYNMYININKSIEKVEPPEGPTKQHF